MRTDAELERWENEAIAYERPSMQKRLLALIAEVRRLRARGAPGMDVGPPAPLDAYGPAMGDGRGKSTTR